MNLPNKITLFRIFLIPIIMIVYAIPSWNATPMFEGAVSLTVANFIILLLIFIGAISDFLDGMLARKYNLITNFGKFLDPIADKLLVVTGFIILVDQYTKNGTNLFQWWMLAIIVAREFIVSGVRLIAVENNRVIAASKWGKVKTVIQLVTLIYLFLGAGKVIKPGETYTTGLYEIIALLLIYATLVATVFSGWDYIAKNKDVILSQATNKKQPKKDNNHNNHNSESVDNNQSKNKKKKK